MNEHVERKLQVTIMGAKDVGKTTALASFMGQDITKTKATIGIASSTRNFTIGPGRAVVVDYLDTQGVDMSTVIPVSYYRNSHGIICMFDITNRKSFEHLQILVKTVFQKTQEPNTQIVLIGNKLDLSSERQVKIREGEEFAREYDCDYFEVSAKENRASVEAAFQQHMDKVTQVFCPSCVYSARSNAPLLTPRSPGETAMKLSLDRQSKPPSSSSSSSCSC